MASRYDLRRVILVTGGTGVLGRRITARRAVFTNHRRSGFELVRATRFVHRLAAVCRPGGRRPPAEREYDVLYSTSPSFTANLAAYWARRKVHVSASVPAEQFFERIGRIVRVRTSGHTSFLVRREEGRASASPSIPMAVDLRMPSPGHPAVMLAAVSEIGTVALRLFDHPLEFAGNASAMVPAYYVLKFVYNVPGPIFCHRVPSGRPERMRIRLFNGPGVIRPDQEYPRWEREEAGIEARRFNCIRVLLKAGILISQVTGCSDAAWFTIVRSIVSFDSACRAGLQRVCSAARNLLVTRKLSQTAQGRSRS